MENGMNSNLITIHNRYGNPIEFNRIDENRFIMSGGQWIRMGFDANVKPEENKYLFVDPSGGPYISQGMSMGYIHQNWFNKIVRHCSYANRIDEFKDKKDNDILIVTYPENIVRATVNQQPEFRIYSERGVVIETTSNFNDAVKRIEDKYDERRQTS